MLADAIAAVMPECQVQQFTDPLLSAKYICNNPVDMVFVADAMRPVSGVRLLQVLHKNIAKLAVVMLSSGERNRIDAIHAGVDDYFVKPISAEVLGDMLKQFVTWQDNLTPIKNKKGEIS